MLHYNIIWLEGTATVTNDDTHAQPPSILVYLQVSAEVYSKFTSGYNFNPRFLYISNALRTVDISSLVYLI